MHSPYSPFFFLFPARMQYPDNEKNTHIRAATLSFLARLHSHKTALSPLAGVSWSQGHAPVNSQFSQLPTSMKAQNLGKRIVHLLLFFFVVLKILHNNKARCSVCPENNVGRQIQFGQTDGQGLKQHANTLVLHSHKLNGTLIIQHWLVWFCQPWRCNFQHTIIYHG